MGFTVVYRGMVPIRALRFLVLIAGGILFSPGTFAASEVRSIYGIHDHTPEPSEYLSALFSWPAGAGDVALQSAITVGTTANWPDVSTFIAFTNDEFRAALPVAGAQRFFRLRFR